MAWYNTTNFTTGDSLFDIFKTANQYTQNMFGTLFLLGFFVMLLIITGRYEMKHRITVASWSTGVLGILFVPLGLVSDWVIYLMIILFVGGFISLFLGD